jgi:hypothetical protein
VLRAGTTVGGGRIIDPSPARHADPAAFAAAARGETRAYAPTRTAGGEWAYSDEWLDEFRADLERRLDAADPLDPGIPAPTEPWASAVLTRLEYERRGAMVYRPGEAGSLGNRAAEAAELVAKLGLEPIKVEDTRLARFLEERGRLVRVGDSYAVSPIAYDEAKEVLVTELGATGRITLARFRDLIGASRKTAQLLLERFDSDGVTRRIGDERRLRGSTKSRPRA